MPPSAGGASRTLPTATPGSPSSLRHILTLLPALPRSQGPSPSPFTSRHHSTSLPPNLPSACFAPPLLHSLPHGPFPNASPAFPRRHLLVFLPSSTSSPKSQVLPCLPPSLCPSASTSLRSPPHCQAPCAPANFRPPLAPPLCHLQRHPHPLELKSVEDVLCCCIRLRQRQREGLQVKNQARDLSPKASS